MVAYQAISPHPQLVSKRHIININPVVEQRGLLRITRHPFHLYGSEVIPETEDKRPNIITKDAHTALISQDILRVFGAVSQDSGHLNDQIYIFLINHNILPTYIVLAAVDI